MYIVKFPILENDDADDLCITWASDKYCARWGIKYALVFSTEGQAEDAINSKDHLPSNAVVTKAPEVIPEDTEAMKVAKAIQEEIKGFSAET